MFASTLRRGARVSWETIRTNVIREVCVGPGVGSAPLPVSALVRGDPEIIARLDCLIEGSRRAAMEVVQEDASSALAARARLASLLDLRGAHREALELFATEATSGCARDAPPLPSAVRLLLEVAGRHASLATQRGEVAARGHEVGGATPVHLPVERVDANVITAAEFSERFISPGRPCVIRGSSAVPRWTPEALCERLGQRRVPLRRCDEASSSWARLEFAGSVPFADFFSANIAGRTHARGDPQLFDYSIWQSCADIFGDEVLMPKWFSVDLYTYATARVHPVSGSASPTLFLAAAGTGSSLHVDFLQTHFWMGLCHGRKRWRLVPREDLAFLYPKYLIDLNPSFPVDLDTAAALARESDGGRFPSAAQCRVHEVVLEPGDIIFVPFGWPHQVENLETSVAVSANFIDRSNLAEACRDAELLGFTSEDPKLLAGLLQGEKAALELRRLEASLPENHLPLRAFKARHGEARTPHETRAIMMQVVVVVAMAGGAVYLLGKRWPWSRNS